MLQLHYLPSTFAAGALLPCTSLIAPSLKPATPATTSDVSSTQTALPATQTDPVKPINIPIVGSPSILKAIVYPIKEEKVVDEPSAEPPQGTILGNRKREDSQPALKAFTIPSCIPKDVALKAEKIQDALFNLLIMAEIYGWNALFNYVMDAFRYEEKRLSRITPSLDHLDKASIICHAPATRQFLHEYAYFLGVKNKAMTSYIDLTAKYPAFSMDMMYMLDGIKHAGGYDREGDYLIQRGGGPLEVPRHLYHLNTEELVEDSPADRWWRRD